MFKLLGPFNKFCLPNSLRKETLLCLEYNLPKVDHKGLALVLVDT